MGLQRLSAAAIGNDEPTTYHVSDLQGTDTAGKGFKLAAAYKADELQGVFDRAEAARKQVAEKIVVDTPDAFINAAAAALCVAANGDWDATSHAFMHGAVAWRTKLLGWRGGYMGDALGWHERTEQHLSNWISKQSTDENIPEKATPDARRNLSCDDYTMLHSNGDMSKSHYDMNLSAIDVMLRHLLWTGDLKYAKQVWPVIERHLAWERRCFRREFGAEKLPLYEAYCCIWASDNLQYEGGGVTHASAYNYYHNKMAARIAKLIGENPAPYEKEAADILKAMQKYLWMSEEGSFAEFKDLLGLQLTHPAAGLWTVYHSVDSEVTDNFQSWQLGRYIDSQIPHIPVHGPGVPDEQLFTVPETHWLPYAWSTNNVVCAEVAHTALSQWQAGRSREAFSLLKGDLLDVMFMSTAPGNLPMSSYFDPYRRESQRDFSDPAGVISRTLIEGLFGIHPDSLAGELFIRPGFPLEWERASIKHTDFNFSYQRSAQTETFIIEPKFPAPMRLRLQCAARGDGAAIVTINGQAAKWTNVDSAIATPLIELSAEAAPRYEITIQWDGALPAVSNATVAAKGQPFTASVSPAQLLEVYDPQHALSDVKKDASAFQAVPVGQFGNRTAFAKVKQGDFTWWAPIQFEIRPPLQIIASADQDEKGLRFKIRNNTDQPINGSAKVRSAAFATQLDLHAPAFADTPEITLSGGVPGSNPISIDFDSGQHVEAILANWSLPASKWARFEPVDLSSILNDRVGQIFKNEYLSPRSPYCSLAIPKQGIGGWCAFDTGFNVDDSGLRTAAEHNGGNLILPQGIPLKTTGGGDAKNIAFTSQWDNYPHDVTTALTGRSSHAYLLMAGSTNNMQSQFDNGEVIVTYADGSTQRLALRNPETWWPIEQDYFIDDYAFSISQPIPPRVDLKTGTVRLIDRCMRRIAARAGARRVGDGAGSAARLSQRIEVAHSADACE